MDTMMSRVWAYFWLPETKYVIVAIVVFALLSLRLLPKERRRVGGTVAVFCVCLVGQALRCDPRGARLLARRGDGP
jgi:hypothetical protein